MVKAPIEWKGDKRLLRCSRSLVIATSTKKSATLKIRWVTIPGYSPSVNVIENLFGTTQRVLDQRQVESPSKTVKETKARFRKILDECEKSGEIKRAIKSMPNRLKCLIKAKGGPIKY